MQTKGLGRDLILSLIGAILSLIVTGAAGVASNWLTGGAVVRLLGGATRTEVEALEKKLGAAINLPEGAVIAFDRPGGCPPGWELEDDAVGRAIVGVGATLAGVNGNPLKGYDLGTYQYANDAKPKSPGFPHTRGHHPPTYIQGKENESQPVSEYVYGVMTETKPTFLHYFIA